ncbi:hypothetical protein AB0D67_38685 [Streptosporangium sp. NPDC048047]|uniref:hypothetical protein n=1 Tax=Streptosporangium sp. NPDC048047 TaxID=3155748 RepID=UPI0034220F55
MKRHLNTLGKARHLLDEGIQYTAAQWEDKIPRFREMDACARASDIRQYVSACWAPSSKDTLDLEVRFNNGLLLHDDSAGRRMRVKTRPRSPKTGAPLPVTDASPQMDLFGNMVSPGLYEIAVLWSIDFRTATLGAATLAAVDFGIDDNGPVFIYAEEEIPTLSVGDDRGGEEGGQTASPQPGGFGPTDDFNEFLGDQEEDFGPNPA